MGLIFILSLLFWGWAEVSTFIYVGNELGGLITLLGIFVTAIIGIALLKSQGLSVLNRIRSDLAKGQTPVSSVADSIALIIGGVLMLIPGYLTDAIGLLLFTPGLRTLAGIFFINWFANSKKFNGFVNYSGNIFQSGHGNRAKTNDKNTSFKYDEKYSQHRASEEIIEGDFKERVGPVSKLQQNKTKQD